MEVYIRIARHLEGSQPSGAARPHCPAVDQKAWGAYPKNDIVAASIAAMLLIRRHGDLTPKTALRLSGTSTFHHSVGSYSHIIYSY